MTRTDKTRFLAGQWQDIMQDPVEQVRAGVSLHQFEPIFRIDFDLDLTSCSRKTTPLHMTKVTDQISANLLTVCKKIQ